MAGHVLAGAAGLLTAAAYLDAKYHISHDLSFRSISPQTKEALKYIEDRTRDDRLLSYHILEEQALGDAANRTLLVFENRTWTYLEFYHDVLKVGHWLLNVGIDYKEIVALNGGNSPEYIMLWFAIDAIGAAPAFINCNLTSDPLIHCVQVAKSRFLIADSDIVGLVGPYEASLASAGVKTVYYKEGFADSLPSQGPLPRERSRGISPQDLRCLIYTSGTTGLPKGTIMRTGRDLNTGRTVAMYLKLKATDRFYTCMPLYHGAAHGLCVTPAIHAGCTLILSRKFSHKTFWPEICANEVNIVQYVGELCRYLLNAPPSKLDRAHKVYMMWGNGMRPDVWEPFRQRFGVEVINELYAATDGLGASFNHNRGDFSVNAIGVRGLLWNLINGKLEVRVKVDPATEEILRDAKGFAIKCGVDEPGEVVYKMDPPTQEEVFAGYYQNKNATQKRKIANLFEKGDLWFRSGDMMRVDSAGRVFFVDRLGDTFRWKSENVSTNEVGDVVGQFPQIAEANVYGALVPHADGRCGVAAIVLADGVDESKLDLAALAHHCISTLPRYAVPIFLRLTPALQYTGTMKLQKGKLRLEGIDVDKVEAGGDRLYWLPNDGKAYRPFTKEDWRRLQAGEVRL